MTSSGNFLFSHLTCFWVLGLLNEEISNFFYPQVEDALPRVLPIQMKYFYVRVGQIRGMQTTVILNHGKQWQWKLLMWLISLYGISSWSQKLWKALTHRCLPGCLPIWPSQGLATTLHYNNREQTQGYWVGVGVGCWVGCCSFKSSDLLHIKFERQIRLTWSGIWAELRLDNQVGELSDQ